MASLYLYKRCRESSTCHSGCTAPVCTTAVCTSMVFFYLSHLIYKIKKNEYSTEFMCSLMQWAFGVTCWEIFNGGKTPHATVHPMNMLKLLEDKYRMEKPTNSACTDEMLVLVINKMNKVL